MRTLRILAPVAALALALGSASAAAVPAAHPTQEVAPVDPTATDTTNDSDGIDGTGPDGARSMDAAQAPAPTYPAATTFASPLKAKSYYVSSYYGGRCIVLPGASTMHLGIDLAAPGGTPIYAVAAGRVTHTVNGTSAVAGYITIEHRVGSEIYQSRYLHMWSATTHVKVGDIVKAGQQISVVGTSGGSTGNHLHLEWWKGPWGAASAMEPSGYLKSKSVDLIAGSIAVTAKPTPPLCTYYTTTGVNFRTGPSTSASIIRLLSQGTKMTHVPGLITSGFIPVTIGTSSGWVSSSYVTPNKPPAPPAPPTQYVTSVGANMRAQATVESARVLIIPRGEVLGEILASSGDYRKFTYQGTTGWVLAKAITPKVEYVTTTGVNMRARPTVKAVRVLIIPKGENLGVLLETKGDYRKFTYRGTTGWVHSKYIVSK